jgi:hypothetical protein
MGWGSSRQGCITPFELENALPPMTCHLILVKSALLGTPSHDKMPGVFGFCSLLLVIVTRAIRRADIVVVSMNT